MSGTPANFAPVQSHQPLLKLGTLYPLHSIGVKSTAARQAGDEVGWSWGYTNGQMGEGSVPKNRIGRVAWVTLRWQDRFYGYSQAAEWTHV